MSSRDASVDVETGAGTWVAQAQGGGLKKNMMLNKLKLAIATAFVLVTAGFAGATTTPNKPWPAKSAVKQPAKEKPRVAPKQVRKIETAAEHFKELDVNRDGKLSAAERKAGKGHIVRNDSKRKR